MKIFSKNLNIEIIFTGVHSSSHDPLYLQDSLKNWNTAQALLQQQSSQVRIEICFVITC